MRYWKTVKDITFRRWSKLHFHFISRFKKLVGFFSVLTGEVVLFDCFCFWVPRLLNISGRHLGTPTSSPPLISSFQPDDQSIYTIINVSRLKLCLFAFLTPNINRVSSLAVHFLDVVSRLRLAHFAIDLNDCNQSIMDIFSHVPRISKQQKKRKRQTIQQILEVQCSKKQTKTQIKI